MVILAVAYCGAHISFVLTQRKEAKCAQETKRQQKVINRCLAQDIMGSVAKRFIAATSLCGVYVAAQQICEPGGSGTILPLFADEHGWDKVRRQPFMFLVSLNQSPRRGPDAQLPA